jgi:hypothetical protein
MPSVAHVEQRVNDRNGTPTSHVLSIDCADEKNHVAKPQPLQSRPGRGFVAELALWPAEDGPDASASSGSSKSHGDSGGQQKAHDSDDVGKGGSDTTMTRRRPVWEETDPDGDDIDDYHAMMRKI